MSVIMADVKPKTAAKKSAKRPAAEPVRDTFTVRDMNRQPQVVLTAARTLGRVHIQSRTGERYSLEPEAVATIEPEVGEDFLTRLQRFHDEMNAAGSTGFTQEGWDAFSKVIAGEE